MLRFLTIYAAAECANFAACKGTLEAMCFSQGPKLFQTRSPLRMLTRSGSSLSKGWERRRTKSTSSVCHCLRTHFTCVAARQSLNRFTRCLHISSYLSAVILNTLRGENLLRRSSPTTLHGSHGVWMCYLENCLSARRSDTGSSMLRDKEMSRLWKVCSLSLQQASCALAF